MEKDSFAASSGVVAATPGGGGAAPEEAGGEAAASELLRVAGVTVRFGSFTAVEEVSFSLRGGQTLGLIGPNGSGKTTLLRTIASLQVATAGRVAIHGQWVWPGSEDAARHIGFTADVPPLYEGMTVRRFLEFIAAGYGIMPEETPNLIDFWLEKVWLTEKAGTKIRGLSRGMKQRVGVARTLLPNPSVILLDEPASGLDPAGRVQFRRLLMDLREQGKTLILSSHLLADMPEYCTHIAIMSKGRLVKFGTVAEVAAGADDGRCRYTLELAEPFPNLEGELGAMEGVMEIEPGRLRVSFTFGAEKGEAAALLRVLVGKGMAVSAFVAHAPGLEEAYLRSGIRQVD
jgi:ABC-2 type transport system ATP-binding protein